MFKNGTVKWFNDAKGFGFIEPEGGGPDVFAHFSAILMDGYRTLKQGSSVTFELVEGPKGQLAHSINTIAPAPAPGTAADAVVTSGQPTAANSHRASPASANAAAATPATTAPSTPSTRETALAR